MQAQQTFLQTLEPTRVFAQFTYQTLDSWSRARRVIVYAEPVRRGAADRWVDNDPRFGPHCIAYQKPVIIERLEPRSPAWRNYRAWQTWRSRNGQECSRHAAWQRVEQELGETLLRRLT